MALAGAINDMDETMTSSPSPIPATNNAKCKAAVPFTVATECTSPMYSLNTLSKRVTNEPTEETYDVSMHSFTYTHSLPLKTGTDSGIKEGFVLTEFILHKLLYYTVPG